MIRNLYNNLDVLKSKQIRKNGLKIYEYSFDEILLSKLFQLILKLKIKNLDKNILDNFGYEIKDEPIEMKDETNYMFGKK